MTASGVHVEPGWRPLNGLEGVRYLDDTRSDWGTKDVGIWRF